MALIEIIEYRMAKIRGEINGVGMDGPTTLRDSIDPQTGDEDRGGGEGEAGRVGIRAGLEMDESQA